MSQNKFEKNVRVGCGALIINDLGQVLLLKRKNTRNERGFWNQPGGGVEFGETIEEAIKREIKEELGVEVALFRYLCFTDQILRKEDQHWIAISYLAKIKKGIPKNIEPHKHEEIGWFNLTKLPENLAQTTKDSIASYQKLWTIIDL